MTTSPMESLLQASNLENLKAGGIVKGTVVEIRSNDVVVDIGGKSEGIIPANEFFNLEEIQVGSEIEVYLAKLEDKNGNPVLSYDKAQQKKNWENILERCPEGSVMPGKVKSKVKGGLIVNIMGVDAFLPASQIDVQAPKNLDQYIGQTYDFKILKINLDRKNIVISHRELIEREREEKRRQFLDEVKVGDVRRGTVKNITDYGAFIDLYGLDGLLHITDMSWGRISHPSEVLKVGEELDVAILDIDYNKQRVSLGLKQLHSNPWDNIEAKYPIGSHVQGKVVNLVPYGAFVEIEQGVEGLIHITEISWTKRISKPSEVFKVGQVIDAIVLSIEKNDRKIGLGTRQLEDNPWDMAVHNYPVGARVRGRVKNLTTFGVFIELPDGLDGLIHVSDISWTRKINHPSEVLKKGDEVDAVVLDVQASQARICLGIKQLHEDPWSNINHYFKIGDIVSGKVSKIASFGAFIDLQNDIDGLVHISQIKEEHVDKIKDVLSVGDDVTARVIKIDQGERRIGLSIKAAHYDEARLAAEVAAYDKIKNDSQLTSLGDILDEATRDRSNNS